MIEVGLFGASGYTGHELVRLLLRHPHAHLRFATSRSHAGRSLAQVFPGAPDLPLVAPEEAPLEDVEALFLCLPHGASAETAAAALQLGVRVIDLSADFRLQDTAAYAQWYGIEHPAPDLLKEAVYGLTEVARAALPRARLVANPGCYPTSVLLALYPLVQAGAVAGPVIVDAKSGVSGAGRTPSLTTHFVEVADNLKPYKIGRAHRHLPEMEQALARWSADPPPLVFAPHLLPVPRGLLSTLYVPLAADWDECRLRALYQQAYGREPCILLLPPQEPATLAHALHTNRCALGLTVAGGTLIVTSAIDNLLKGASGQAVQNFNAMFGFDEQEGLI